jgi:hypothetical protein
MAGRPKKIFSEKDIEQMKVLARCHCPDSEIAAWFGVAERTIQRHFATLLKEQREAGKANIRAKQYRLAMDGDKTMLIWLGKQLLGQREKTDITLERLPDAMLIEEAQRRIAAKNNDA